MRFKLLLQINKNTFGDRISMNYAYELSSLIYRVLSQSDNIFSQWLHDNGFKSGNKRFKLFTFSRLHIPRYRIEKDCIRILSDTIEWYISFLPERTTQEFIQGIFHKQTLELGTHRGKIQLFVQEISVLPPPTYDETMEFKTLSPICVSIKRENDKIDYLSPDSLEALPIIRQNLLNKHYAFYGKEYAPNFDFGFEVLSKPKSVLITIKAGTPAQTRVRGFMCRCRMTAPPELIKIAYDAGIGEKGSMGFGMVKNVK